MRNFATSRYCDLISIQCTPKSIISFFLKTHSRFRFGLGDVEKLTIQVATVVARRVYIYIYIYECQRHNVYGFWWDKNEQKKREDNEGWGGQWAYCDCVEIFFLYLQKSNERGWLTTELQETSSLMRTITSWVKVPGHSTWDTRPLAQASWAVSFRPLSNISLAWEKRGREREDKSWGEEGVRLSRQKDWNSINSS